MKSILLCLLLALVGAAQAADRPNIVFVMADDMGWGETGYRGHPILKTPNLDAMAANGLRLDRFYAGCPVCSPTRASVLTGRSPDRAGVLSHGFALRLQEKTIAQALQAAGYTTGHFGKWHLNGLKGPGAPILKTDPRSPGAFGFAEWVSMTNYFDQDPILSRMGEIVERKGDSSDVIVAEANTFIESHRAGPFFAVIWFGSPHGPAKALEADKTAFAALDEDSQNHYGELVALDRSVGALRQKLRDLGIADQTLVMFNSDNGGLLKIAHGTVGGLRGSKSNLFEGGVRVPGILEWPAKIKPRVTTYPACTMDLFPTIAEIVGLPESTMVQPIDGISLLPLFAADPGERSQPIPFRHGRKAALTGQQYKILTENFPKGPFQLYDLLADPEETKDLSAEQPERFAKLKADLLAWNETVEASFAGRDYPEGKLTEPDPEPIAWSDHPSYEPYLQGWKERWEYEAILRRKLR